MKILLLSPYPNNIIKTLENSGDSYEIYLEKLNLRIVEEKSIDFIISFGYQHIISKEIIEKYPDSIINLHISFLPFNKGSHPNLWSHLEKTPSGVSIHLIDEGLDTGGIICRKKIFIDREKHTFRTSYKLLKSELENLFQREWSNIKKKNYELNYPFEKGSFHFKKDGIDLLDLFPEGWDTNINKGISEFNNFRK